MGPVAMPKGIQGRSRDARKLGRPDGPPGRGAASRPVLTQTRRTTSLSIRLKDGGEAPQRGLATGESRETRQVPLVLGPNLGGAGPGGGGLFGLEMAAVGAGPLQVEDVGDR